MALRTYYWAQRNVSIYKYYAYKIRYPKRLFFKYGNTGDIFNIDLIKFLYNETGDNIGNEGNRLLLVGSIAGMIKQGDVINGIGWKGNDWSKMSNVVPSLKVYGVRGPLTRSLFEKYNADLSDLKFEYDPGLLIKEVYGINVKDNKEKNVIFIPHFRDKAVYKNNYPKGMKIVAVDNNPKTVASEILNAKVVYTSSLHGIIFSHALNKPCVFVKPQSDEPLFKYQDYYLSIGMELPVPIKDIYSINYAKDKETYLSKTVGLDDFYFPKKEFLITKKIIY